MGQNIKQDGRLERIMNLVADSEFGLSDEEMLAEIREVGNDPLEEMEDALKTVRGISQQLEILSTRLATLGHRISSAPWRPDNADYTNRCIDCGLIVRLDVSTGKIAGKVLHTPCCSASRYAVVRTGGVS